MILVEKDKMLQKEGVNVYEDTARKMRKFKGIEFPRTHKRYERWKNGRAV